VEKDLQIAFFFSFIEFGLYYLVCSLLLKFWIYHTTLIFPLLWAIDVA